jgi:ATP-dependent Clp protease ATP-binding subunit ClpX
MKPIFTAAKSAAKKTLALAIYNHFKRINNKVVDDVELQKSNVMLIGPSGSGKTHLVQTIARFLDIPFTIADATTLTESGYVGNDVESIFQNLLHAANGDVEKAQHGIVVVDEIDKIAKKNLGANLTKDPGGEGVQQGLLKILEGTKCDIPMTGKRKSPGEPNTSIDTTHILFIFAGAFVGLSDIIQSNSDKNVGIGFGATVDKNLVTRDVEPEDLYKFGFIPELVGRIPVVCTLEELTISDLVKILTEPKNSVIKQYQALVSMDKVELEFSSSSLTRIAEIAFERKTGARGLRSIVENILKEHMFSLPDKENVSMMSVDYSNDLQDFIVTTK